MKPTVSIAIRNPVLRNLLREDLERGGFDVISLSSSDAVDPADVVITDIRQSFPGRTTTVRLTDVMEVAIPGRRIIYPIEALEHLCAILRAESLEEAS